MVRQSIGTIPGQQRAPRMQRIDMVQDQQAFGEDRAVVELEGGHSSDGIVRQQRGGEIAQRLPLAFAPGRRDRFPAMPRERCEQRVTREHKEVALFVSLSRRVI